MSRLSESSPEELLVQLRELEVGPFLFSTAATLASLAFGKLGSRQLPEARLAIDAIGTIVPLLEGRIEAEAKRSLEQTLTNLKLAYAEAAAASSGEPPEPSE